MKTKQYVKPQSSTVLQWICFLAVVASIILFFAGANQRNEVDRGECIFFAVGGLLWALIYWVLAGLREAGERTAYHAERAADLLEKMDMERTVEKAAASSNLRPAPRRFFVEKPGGEQQGPLEVADLQRLLDTGVVTGETPVLREGDEAWKTVADFMVR
jgi:hypothetical protein